jgi:hypothetical protein
MCNLAIGCKSCVYHGRTTATVEMVLLYVGVAMLHIYVAMELLLHSNEDLQISTIVGLNIDVRNMWEVSMEGCHRIL